MYLLKKILIIVSIVFGLGAALAPAQSMAYNVNKNVEVSDPIEGVNRSIYAVNRALDGVIIKPVTKAYRFVVPKIIRKGIRNVLRNLTEPVTFVNSVLQLDQENSFTTFWRFTVNTTFGIGGIFDVADVAGLKHRKEDFGQTAGVYGAGHGPYIMLPLLGPSNTRDAFGRVVDVFTNPWSYTFNDYALVGHAVVNGVDTREDTLELVDEIDRVSLDPYATIRSLYTQKREDEIANGEGK